MGEKIEDCLAKLLVNGICFIQNLPIVLNFYECQKSFYAGTHIDVFSGHINMLRHLYFVLRIDDLSDISPNKQLSIVLWLDFISADQYNLDF